MLKFSELIEARKAKKSNPKPKVPALKKNGQPMAKWGEKKAAEEKLRALEARRSALMGQMIDKMFSKGR